MTAPLFDPVDQREGAILVGETTFEFIQRGARPEAVAVRGHLESWFRAIPLERRASLKKRLQEKDFHSFMSVYFELQVHQFLRRQGCRVEIEPKYPFNANATVDFYAINDKQQFYLEATVCGLSKDFLNYSNNEFLAVNKLREALKNEQLLHSDLHLEAEGELKRTLGKEVIAPFAQLLRNHSAGTVAKVIDQYGPGYWTYHWRVPNPPIATFECNGWVLSGWLAPPIASDDIGQVVGPARSEVCDSSVSIKNSLYSKAKHWRRLKRANNWKQDKPIFLIAINVCVRNDFDEKDICQAIYGSPSHTGSGLRDFSYDLREVNGIIVVTNGTLGRESVAPVRLYRNGESEYPICFDHIQHAQRLSDILGIGT